MNPVRTAADAEERRDDFEWGTLRWYASRELSGTPGLTVGRCAIRPGMANPRHSHPDCDEVLHLLAGELDHSLGDAVHRLRPGDTITIPSGVPHNASNVGDVEAVMVIAFSSGDRTFRPEE